MKLKAVLVGKHNERTVKAFGSAKFTARFLDEIVDDHFGVKDARQRPAEYYMQKPDFAESLDGTGLLGVEVRLTGVSRGNRPAKLFHEALKTLSRIVVETIQGTTWGDKGVQVFCIIMLDGDVENPPGSGNYSSMIESPSIIVST
jgi:hypothetical protein